MITRIRRGQARVGACARHRSLLNALVSSLPLSFIVPSCGSSPPPAAQPPPAASAEPAPAPVAQAAPAPAEPEAEGLPTKCADGNAPNICAPPRTFVEKLCGGYPQPDVALAMFAKASPWTRAYLNRNVEAWYTTGRNSTKAQLVFDEEVLVLRHPKDGGGGIIVNGGSGPYDVLRWDGVCASLGGEEITLKRPPAPKRPSIPWQHLEANVRDALLGDATIAKAEASRRKECKGTTSLGMMSAGCVKADDKLTGAIVDYVMKGGETPLPVTNH